tara:strand:- start:90 stop:353 length:264 start_codon:yes stop_codon:yes gene_type:complete
MGKSFFYRAPNSKAISLPCTKLKSHFAPVRETQNPTSMKVSELTLIVKQALIQLKVKIVGYLRLFFIFAHSTKIRRNENKGCTMHLK